MAGCGSPFACCCAAAVVFLNAVSLAKRWDMVLPPLAGCPVANLRTFGCCCWCAVKDAGNVLLPGLGPGCCTAASAAADWPSASCVPSIDSLCPFAVLGAGCSGRSACRGLGSVRSAASGGGGLLSGELERSTTSASAGMLIWGSIWPCCTQVSSQDTVFHPANSALTGHTHVLQRPTSFLWEGTVILYICNWL